ncbi:MAG: hypothetical protein IPL89_03905 [Acidobacteria bacterium]|nr:hypothetical protein [Acidobacteriota bacterium]
MRSPAGTPAKHFRLQCGEDRVLAPQVVGERRRFGQFARFHVAEIRTVPRLEVGQASSLKAPSDQDREEDDEENSQEIGEEADRIFHLTGVSLSPSASFTFKEILLFL